MAAITVSERRVTGKTRSGGQVVRYSGTSAANSADTLTSTVVASSKRQRLSYVTCKYSAAPTQAGVTTAIDSQLGSAYDTTLSTGSANVQSTVFIPDSDFWMDEGDAIVVSAPAGGVGITSAIVICVEEF